MYLNHEHLTDCGLAYIKSLLNNFNSKRTDFTMPIDHKIVISPYWLLGLLEGDGCFSFHLFGVNLVLSLTAVQRPVLLAIKDFLDNLAQNSLYPSLHIDRSFVNLRPAQSLNEKDQYCLTVSSLYYIFNYLIPFFDQLDFQSKKRLDFLDWKLLATIVVKGTHFSILGKAIFVAIKSRMNASRLSTNKNHVASTLNSLANYDISTLIANYCFGAQNELINIATGSTITPVQYYALVPNNNTSLPVLFFKSQKEIAVFFNVKEYVLLDVTLTGEKFNSIDQKSC